MSLQALDHFTVMCADLDRSRAFYSGALGLVDGDRPAIPIPGAWMYLGNRPVVHLMAAGKNAEAGPTGAFDHLAFEASDFTGVHSRLKALDLDFQEAALPDFNLRQIFLHDPDGVKIELNFRG